MTNLDMRHLIDIAEAPATSTRREPAISPPGVTPASPPPASTASPATAAATALHQAMAALTAQHLTSDQIKAILTQWKQELNKPATPQPAASPISRIPIGSTINRSEGQFKKTATGWIGPSGQPVIPGKAKALDAQMMAVLQKRGLSESRKPIHIRFTRSAKKKA